MLDACINATAMVIASVEGKDCTVVPPSSVNSSTRKYPTTASVMASKAADAIEASLLLKFGRNWPGIRLRRRMPHVLGASDGRLEAPVRCPRCTS